MYIYIRVHRWETKVVNDVVLVEEIVGLKTHIGRAFERHYVRRLYVAAHFFFKLSVLQIWLAFVIALYLIIIFVKLIKLF